MNTERICPSCQKPLPPGLVQELCPECLMKAGFASTVGPGADQAGAPRFVAPPIADLARLFPQLEILELLGQGGMGAVYKARQPGLERVVALKILPPECTADPGFAERFAREARALARLNHPNIVSIFDFGQAGTLHYFIMEFVDGLNLRQLEQAGRLAPRQALEIVPQICEALQFAHDEGIVHRDIKPENVMVDKRGRVKITDFGLAKLLGKEPEVFRLTGAKDVMGTPHYMAPEQIEKPQTVDHRADIYSLGVVFYELLTGELPIGKFAPPSRKVSVDVRLDEVVLHTLEKEPERRYQHASQVKTDVESIARSAGVPPIAAAAPPVGDPALSAALGQVKGPAIGLVITGLLNWLLIPLVTIVAGRILGHGGMPKLLFLSVPLAALVLSSIIFLAGLKMKRLQAYWLAVCGSVLAIFVSPGNIVGLPVGIWALVVLSQKQVRDMFRKEHPWPLMVESPPRRGGGWAIAAVVVGGILLLGAILAFLVVLFFTARVVRTEIPERPAGYVDYQSSRVTPAQKGSAAQFGPVTQVSLHDIDDDPTHAALDLDSGELKEIPASIRSQPEAEGVKQLAEQGIDLSLDQTGDRWGLLTPADNELVLTPRSDDEWLNGVADPPLAVLPQVFDQTVRTTGWVVYVLSANSRPPLTFSFKTANGSTGLLRIVSFSERPNAANLQFKQLKAAAEAE